MFEWFQANEPQFELPRADRRTEWFLGPIFIGWTRRDADSALNAAVALPKEAARRDAVVAALLTSLDGTRVLENERFTLDENLAFIQAMPTGEARSKELAGCLESADRDRAREVWRDAREELRRELVAGGFAPQENNEDPFAPNADRIADGFDGLESMFREKAESSGDMYQVRDFLQLCRADWAKRDLPGAFAWVQSHLRGDQQVDQAAYLFRSAAEADFDAARALWNTLPPSTLRVRALQEIVSGAPLERREDVEALIRSLPPRDAARIRGPGESSDPFASRPR